LHVPNDIALRYRQIVTMGIELRSENFNICNVFVPQDAQRVADENVLNDSLAKRRMTNVFVNRCRQVVSSAAHTLIQVNP